MHNWCSSESNNHACHTFWDFQHHVMTTTLWCCRARFKLTQQLPYIFVLCVLQRFCRLCRSGNVKLLVVCGCRGAYFDILHLMQRYPVQGNQQMLVHMQFQELPRTMLNIPSATPDFCSRAQLWYGTQTAVGWRQKLISNLRDPNTVKDFHACIPQSQRRYLAVMTHARYV